MTKLLVVALFGVAAVTAWGSEALALKRPSYLSQAQNLRGIVRDGAGNAIVVGDGGGPAVVGGLNLYGRHIFIGKYRPDGATIFTKTIQGNGLDQATGVALDAAGSIYVCGYTASTNFPVTGAAQATQAGLTDAFLLKLSADGTQTLFSTYWGGLGDDRAMALAVDASGAATVVGTTNSLNLRTITPVWAMHAGREGFVARFSTNGIALFSSYIGSAGDDDLTSVAVDSAGNVYLGGTMGWNDAMRMNALPLPARSYWIPTGWVAKIDPGRSAVAYATYLSPEVETVSVQGVAVDSQNALYAMGLSRFGLYLAKLDAAGGKVVLSKEIPLPQRTAPRALALGPPFEDGLPAIYLTGTTVTGEFPIAGGPQVMGGGGFFVSDNSGATFYAPASSRVDGTASVAITPSRLWVGGGYSVDGGAHWYSWGRGGSLLVPDPVQPDSVVYSVEFGSRPVRVKAPSLDQLLPRLQYEELTGGLGDLGNWDGSATALYADTEYVYLGIRKPGVYRLRLGGNRWEKVGSGLPAGAVVNAFGGLPDKAGIVYAATSKGLFKTTDGGAAWSAAGTGLPSGEAVTAAIDPRSAQTVWASVAGAGLYQSNNGGAAWIRRLPVTGGAISAIAFNPSNAGEIVIGLSGGCDSTESQSPGGVYRSTDGGATWNLGGLNQVPVTGLVFDPKNAKRLYANTCGGGDIFITAFRPSGELKWSTYAGSALGADESWAIAVSQNAAGEAVVTVAGNGTISGSGVVTSLGRQDRPNPGVMYQIREAKAQPLEVTADTAPPGIGSVYYSDLAWVEVKLRNTSDQNAPGVSLYANLPRRDLSFDLACEPKALGAWTIAPVTRCNLGDIAPGREVRASATGWSDNFHYDIPKNSVFTAWAVYGFAGELLAVSPGRPVVLEQVVERAPAVESVLSDLNGLGSGAEGPIRLSLKNPGTAPRKAWEVGIYQAAAVGPLVGLPGCVWNDIWLMPGQTRDVQCLVRVRAPDPPPEDASPDRALAVYQGLVTVLPGQQYFSPKLEIQGKPEVPLRSTALSGALTGAYFNGDRASTPLALAVAAGLPNADTGTMLAFVASSGALSDRIRQLECRKGACGIRSDIMLPDQFGAWRLRVGQWPGQDVLSLTAIGRDSIAWWPLSADGDTGPLVITSAGDGISDFAVLPDQAAIALVRANRIFLYKPRADGAFEMLAGDYEAPGEAARAVFADLNRDGIADMVAWPRDGAPVMRLGQAGYVFGDAAPLSGAAWLAAVMAGDLDGDEAAELIMVARDGTTAVLKNDGAGGFTEAWRGRAGPGAVTGVSGLRELNGDGKPDFAVLDSTPTLAFQLGHEDNSLTGGGVWTVPSGFSAVQFEDINRDGTADVVLLGAGGIQVFLRLPPQTPPPDLLRSAASGLR